MRAAFGFPSKEQARLFEVAALDVVGVKRNGRRVDCHAESFEGIEAAKKLAARFEGQEVDVVESEDDVADWKYEVANGDTRLGFAEWLEHKRDAES